MRSRRHAHEEEHENHERWLITYADMITLLLALFIMMYSFSVVDLKKFQAFEKSVKQGKHNAVHALAGKGDPPSGKPPPEDPGVSAPKPAMTPEPVTSPGSPSSHERPIASKAELEALLAKFRQRIRAAGLADQVEVGGDRRGVAVYVKSGALFASAQARIQPSGIAVLTRLAPVLEGIGNDLVIEGHTDSEPITSADYPTNWELSTARATAVLRWLLARGRISPERVSAAGYADTRPRYPNDTPAHRALNRRVEIVVIASG